MVLEKRFKSRYWAKSVSFQAVRRWLRGEAIPSQDKLQVLAEWLKIEPHVLRFGERATKTVKANRKRWDMGVGYLQRETFVALLAIPASQRKAIREIILALAIGSPAKSNGLPKKLTKPI